VGVLVETHGAVERGAYDDDLSDAEQVSSEAHALTGEQQAAVDALKCSLAENCFRTHLVHGVTGSGKTEVYLQVLRQALDDAAGRSCWCPRWRWRRRRWAALRARLLASGVKAVVWHSHLSDGERYDAWHALTTGEARVVVGARSAIFAPIPKLRLILVDEEHEPAYKQEEVPRYHGRDVAVYRASLCGALCVLGSATPALESLYNAQQGKYRLNRITRRVDDRQLPLVHIVDMKREGRGARALHLQPHAHRQDAGAPGQGRAEHPLHQPSRL
jgi:primosomal protein N' (replication factor Y)